MEELVKRYAAENGATIYAATFEVSKHGDFLGFQLITDKEIPPLAEGLFEENEEISELDFQQAIAMTQKEFLDAKVH